jgi:uncharacterized membrane protein YdjX (TVP38/TMEM64 family)
MIKPTSSPQVAMVGWYLELQLVLVLWIQRILFLILFYFSPNLFPSCDWTHYLCTLAGFAYGMNGFFISGAASILGSAISFTVLRLLFRKRLHAWSSENEKWQALESVVVGGNA